MFHNNITDYDDFQKLPKNNESSIKIYFSAFCDVIYQKILSKSIFIAVSSYKRLFIHFVKHRCISRLNVSAAAAL